MIIGGACYFGMQMTLAFQTNAEHSHNLTYGKNIVQQKNYDQLAEGYYTARALHYIGNLQLKSDGSYTYGDKIK